MEEEFYQRHGEFYVLMRNVFSKMVRQGGLMECIWILDLRRYTIFGVPVFSVSGLVDGGDGAVMCPPHNVHFPLRCNFHHCRLKSNIF